MKKLQTSQFYNDDILTSDIDYKKYTDAQLNRHDLKKHKDRREQYYKQFFDVLEEFLDKNKHYEMICYGTRNNHERSHWEYWFNTFKYDIKVSSLDIAPGSNANFVCDFNKLPDDFKSKWDIIFSNSIDHALNATETFYHWLETLKVGGLLIIFFSCGNGAPSASDCSAFDIAALREFFDNFETKDYVVVKSFLDYSAYIIKRIG